MAPPDGPTECSSRMPDGTPAAALPWRNTPYSKKTAPHCSKWAWGGVVPVGTQA